jgi:hypothetical protein
MAAWWKCVWQLFGDQKLMTIDQRQGSVSALSTEKAIQPNFRYLLVLLFPWSSCIQVVALRHNLFSPTARLHVVHCGREHDNLFRLPQIFVVINFIIKPFIAPASPPPSALSTLHHPRTPQSDAVPPPSSQTQVEAVWVNDGGSLALGGSLPWASISPVT